MYWNLEDDGHVVIKRWLHSRDATPWPKEIWERLSAHEGIARFSEAFGVRERIQSLFGELSNYVHSRGRMYSNDHSDPEHGLLTSRPSEHMIERWIEMHTETVWLILALHLAKYPVATVRSDWSQKFGIDVPMFGGISECEVDSAEDYLSSDAFSLLSQIAEGDAQTQETLSWIESLPDMSEDAVEQQILAMDKTNIEHGGGFFAWEIQERKMQAFVYPDGVPPHVEARMVALRVWAEAHDCLESPEWIMRHLGQDQ